ncbi:unnamed protein product [Acanthoscelides obtectus]|uniref:Uncharacterized protein n=1 Tax=Acanthoscelides obtectus TaxID=200917 RepID=A0A9P0M509_ACAOB|nr:unnamed protein product [Acanthoscelides obtectus]CAK1658849.1 hypothetical protein AOBTE_LOCUS21162 [Acanthoscelides obtectus]
MPGIDWARSLLERHEREINQKVSANLKMSRARISRDIVVEYFNNLRETLKDLPAANVFNYDETNFQDDPGKHFVVEPSIQNAYATLQRQQYQL